MARRKKPENETLDEAKIRQMLEEVANSAERSEKTSWNRKMDNMVKLISKLHPIEDQIIELEAQKMPILDEIAALRGSMVKDCIHPFEQLVYKNEFVECKFCNKKLRISKVVD